MRPSHRALVALSAFLAAPTARFGAQQPAAGPPSPASLVVTNAHIATMDPSQPRAEAMAVNGETITALGSAAAMRRYIGPSTRVIDAGGRLVTPGFNDSHAHFASGSAGLRSLNLYGVASLAEVQRLVAERVARAKPGEWISGSRYDHTLWGERWPTRQDLDAVSPNNPVVLSRASGHSVWANSLALKLSNITKDTPNPKAGEIQKDPKTGEPTGILLESAASLIKRQSPTLPAEERRARSRDDLLAGMRYAAALGLTSVQTSSSLTELATIRELQKEGRLTLRYTGWLTLGAARSLAAQGVRTGQGDDWVRVGFLKGFIDGTLGDGTAAMFEPFADRPDFVGLPRMTQEQLDSAVILADREGFQIGIHAIGDKGVNMVLNAYEKAARVNGTTGRRHRVEHAQVLIPTDVARFGTLGVVASMQPTHATTDMRFAETRLGLQRLNTAYAWRSLLQTGAMLAFGTDWAVEPLDPMRGIFSAVTRTNIQRMEPREGWFPEQKLSVWEGIYYYTYGSAYAEHMETRKGALSPGRLADFVILSDDLFTIAPERILRTKVDMTVVGGRVVFERAKAADVKQGASMRKHS
jgi:predicted amidohydrolase YtcJ